MNSSVLLLKKNVSFPLRGAKNVKDIAKKEWVRETS